jgi:hypothetical protein
MYKTLLKLDMATLKTDSTLKKWIIRNIFRPIGYWARKKNYKKYYDIPNNN